MIGTLAQLPYAVTALSRMVEASGVMSDLSQSKNTMYGPLLQTAAGGGGGGGGGGGV